MIDGSKARLSERRNKWWRASFINICVVRTAQHTGKFQCVHGPIRRKTNMSPHNHAKFASNLIDRPPMRVCKLADYGSKSYSKIGVIDDVETIDMSWHLPVRLNNSFSFFGM